MIYGMVLYKRDVVEVKSLIMKENNPNKIWLYWNSVKRLKPVQIYHQIGKRINKSRKRRLLKYINRLDAPDSQEIKIIISELDYSEEYLGHFDEKMLFADEVKLLHESHKIKNKWNISEASHLWSYNLHYLEFLILLAVRYKESLDEKNFRKFEELIRGWMEQSSEDSFEPYTISMRIPNILICMEILKDRLAKTKLKEEILTSIYQQYQYLLRSQELALLANHYFENLKTIVISSLLFNESKVYHKYFDLLLKQIEEQVLEDGVHFERSFMYHKIVLEDILRIYVVLTSANHISDAEKLVPAIQKMTSAISSIEKGFDRTPLFNDAGNNVSKSKESLIKATYRICGEENYRYDKQCLKEFSESGYYKLDFRNIAVLFDCGEIGPTYMGGHAHCDCLSFELAVNGRMIFVNSGTGQYQGKLRTFFRSTPAHNTIMIDDREQSELWGEHRAGRRIRKVRGIGNADANEYAVTGSFESYLGDHFRREIKWISEKRFVFLDGFIAHDNGSHIARQFLHLAPGYHYERSEKKVLVKDGSDTIASVKLPVESDYLIHKEGVITNYAEEFGEYKRKEVLEIRTPFEDKLCSKVEIEIEAEKAKTGDK